MDEGRNSEVAEGSETPNEVSVASVALGDRPSKEDSLGFTPYVDALHLFLSHRDTEPPLVLSVEGGWGTGKSSFMLQLAGRLQKDDLAAQPGEDAVSPAPVVFFNAWRHDGAEALWAAFALSFLEQLRGKLSRSRQFVAAARLVWKRFEWRSGWLALTRSLLLTLLWAAILIALWSLVGTVTDANAWQRTATLAGGFAGTALSLLAYAQWMKRLLPNPLDVGLREHVRSPDYRARLNFIEEFQRDFGKVIDVYASSHNKVYVFVDDLDRCSIPKAAELMQAIHLMIQDRRLVFVIGMDREKVAMGIAVKYEKILPFLAIGDRKLSHESEKEVHYRLGLEYGYRFLGKFIQLPFRIPSPTQANIQQFIESLAGQTSGPDADPEEVDKGRSRRLLRVKLGHDSQDVARVIQVVSPALDDNPREIKQFLNAFRLKAYVAHETGLFQLDDTKEATSSLTLEQLAKFIALQQRWPLFLLELDKQPDLLARIAGGEDVPGLERWTTDPSFADLLKNELSTGSPENYSMAHVDVRRLLEISPLTPEAELVDKDSPKQAMKTRSVDRAAKKYSREAASPPLPSDSTSSLPFPDSDVPPGSGVQATDRKKGTKEGLEEDKTRRGAS